ncbi:Micro-spherule protein, MCRS1 [Carpediemonas membranifera]|uniref:Micro-spherule protein, MCRS1 n=1 Tax=Carpediemonas membranifera TaxID=201153 RepID=A0A8J6B450_9EUKA|nr:Micro-spherule protein, MCRS1 [Carpediemonas membranifera]|eukprot:KAG9392594.1 Micro-spherule protein, MCRS1 [Carpediemonas membranifera]
MSAALASGAVWSPQDVMLLIQSVEDIRDLKIVHEVVQFSSRYSYSEVALQWWRLLKEPEYAERIVASTATYQKPADLPEDDDEDEDMEEEEAIHADTKTIDDLKETLAVAEGIPEAVATIPDSGHLIKPARLEAELALVSQLEAELTYDYADPANPGKACPYLMGLETSLPVPSEEVTIGCDKSNHINLTNVVNPDYVSPKQAVLYLDRKLHEAFKRDDDRKGYWRICNVGVVPFTVDSKLVNVGQRIRVRSGSMIVFGVDPCTYPFVFVY